jgi:glycosyltransferase involved in cell wall biosynthesis
MPEAMRILFLSDFCPWPLNNGYRQRIFHLIDALARIHEVTLATVMPPVFASEPFPPALRCTGLVPLVDTDCAFRSTQRFECWASARERTTTLLSSPFPNVVRRWRSASIERQLRALHSAGRFDAVWAERPFIAEIARAVGFSRIVVDLPDVESVSAARSLRSSAWYPSKPLHALELAKLYAYDQLLPWRFWRVTVCKDEDRQFFQTRRSNVVTVPNGVPEYPASDDAPEDNPQLLFVGALNFESNIKAIGWFARHVMPLIAREHPRARFVVIGPDPSPAVMAMEAAGECAVLTGVEDLKPHFDMASVFVAPITLGSGTRLKVLEGLARQKPVVATSIAAEGLDLRPGVDIELADSPELFAAACSRLLRDRGRRHQLALAGRTRVLERYLWSDVTRAALTALSDDIRRPDSPQCAERVA